MLLIGCDQFSGPSIRNEFTATVTVIVSYSDGMIYTNEWDSCDVYSFGATEIGKWGVKPKEDVFITQILIEQDKKTVLQFDKKMIDDFKQKQDDQKGKMIWVVSPAGIKLSNEKDCSLLNLN